MNTQSRPSAKIYQFPRKSVARAAPAGREAAADRPAQTPRVEFGGGWYHEAAILAERQRKT